MGVTTSLHRYLLLVMALLVAGCTVATPESPDQTIVPLPTVTVNAPRPTLDQPPIVAPDRFGEPSPYAGLSVEELSERTYGEGNFQIVEVLGVTSTFTRTLVSYESDGLTVYAFMNEPRNSSYEPPYPVVIVNHGYIDPAVYTTLTYTTRYADALASAGFLAIHPNFRNYPPSDPGPNPFRIGYTSDVLNLVGIIQRTAGEPGPFARADADAIGLWGHSMGGGVTLRALTVSDAVKAAILYGSMSGDEARNHERILFFSNGARGLWVEGEEPPLQVLRRISPIYHLERIRAAVGIHHGEFDDQVPLAWSEELCSKLQELKKQVGCYTYPGAGHTFSGASDALFIERTIAFFDQHLRGTGQ